jgi:hypothetical protein
MSRLIFSSEYHLKPLQKTPTMVFQFGSCVLGEPLRKKVTLIQRREDLYAKTRTFSRMWRVASTKKGLPVGKPNR